MKRLFAVLLACFYPLAAMAAVKVFPKAGEEVIPPDKSQDLVVEYLKQRLTREASEEAGMVIKSEFKIENGNISKDEIVSVAATVLETEIVEKKISTKDNRPHVFLRLNVKVDMDSVPALLEKIKKDNRYQAEAEALRKKNIELENRLKTATKQQYEGALSAEVAEQVALQKQHALEYQKIALQAKEEFAKASEEQKARDAQRGAEITSLKQKIAREKADIKKQELTNQLKIKEMEARARKNMDQWKGSMYALSIQEALKQAAAVRKETDDLFANFEQLRTRQEQLLNESYAEQIKLSTNTAPKDAWETTDQYKKRMEKNKEVTQKLTAEKEAILEERSDEMTDTQMQTMRPVVDKLKSFQTSRFHDAQRSRADVLSLGKINADKKVFEITVKYHKKKYKLLYDFADLGVENAKLLYQTPQQFVAEPSFSVSADKKEGVKQVLTAFTLTHLGAKVEKALPVAAKVTPFEELTRFETVYQKWNAHYVDIAAYALPLNCHLLMAQARSGDIHVIKDCAFYKTNDNYICNKNTHRCTEADRRKRRFFVEDEYTRSVNGADLPLNLPYIWKLAKGENGSNEVINFYERAANYNDRGAVLCKMELIGSRLVGKGKKCPPLSTWTNLKQALFYRGPSQYTQYEEHVLGVRNDGSVKAAFLHHGNEKFMAEMRALTNVDKIVKTKDGGLIIFKKDGSVHLKGRFREETKNFVKTAKLTDVFEWSKDAPYLWLTKEGKIAIPVHNEYTDAAYNRITGWTNVVKITGTEYGITAALTKTGKVKWLFNRTGNVLYGH